MQRLEQGGHGAHYNYHNTLIGARGPGHPQKFVWVDHSAMISARGHGAHKKTCLGESQCSNGGGVIITVQ